MSLPGGGRMFDTMAFYNVFTVPIGQKLVCMIALSKHLTLAVSKVCTRLPASRWTGDSRELSFIVRFGEVLNTEFKLGQIHCPSYCSINSTVVERENGRSIGCTALNQRSVSNPTKLLNSYIAVNTQGLWREQLVFKIKQREATNSIGTLNNYYSDIIVFTSIHFE